MKRSTDMPLAIRRAIEGAVAEIDPDQIFIWTRLTPAARMNMVNTLTRDLLSLAVTAFIQDHPDFTAVEAQREVLRRSYATAAL